MKNGPAALTPRSYFLDRQTVKGKLSKDEIDGDEWPPSSRESTGELAFEPQTEE